MAATDRSSNEEQVFDHLVAACPSFLATDETDGYVAFLEDQDTPDRYVRTAALAHHLVELVSRGDTGPATEVFDAAEGILAQGPPTGAVPRAGDISHDGVELVRMGLLETLQNICSHEDVGVDPAVLRSLLGSKSVTVWDELDQLWLDAGVVATDGPRVTLEHYENVVRFEVRHYLQATRRRMPDGRLLAATDIVRYQHSLRDESSVGVARVKVGGHNVRVLRMALLVALVFVVIVRVA